MYSHILFDLDGTLTDSKEGILACVRFALESVALPVPEEAELLKFIGPPLEESFLRQGLTLEQSREAIRLFRSKYVPEGQFQNRAAPGMAEMLGRLRARGFTLALASSKMEAQCRSICDRFGFTPYLTEIAGSSGAADHTKADVIRAAMERMGAADPRVCLMVGDRKYDVEGARACGMDCVGVEFFGYAPPGELEEAGAAAVVQTVEELESFILAHGQPGA